MTGEGDGNPYDPIVRANKLRIELENALGQKKASEVIRQIQQANKRRLKGKRGGPVNVFESKDIDSILFKLWDRGLVALSSVELLAVANYLTDQHLRKVVRLRVFKHYLEGEEYRAVVASYELNDLLNDKFAKVDNRSNTINGLSERIRKYRFGRRIFNQVSVGWLDTITYPKMRQMEKKLSGGSRATSQSDVGAIKQVFYDSIKPDSTKLWVRSTDEPVELFGEIAARLVPEYGKSPSPYLDIYSAGAARDKASEAIEIFINTYPQFITEDHHEADGKSGGFDRLKSRN